MIPIPVTASPDVRLAFQRVGDILSRWDGTLNVDLKGRRMMNATDAVDSGDYVTKRQLDATVAGSRTTPTPVIPGIRDLVRYGTHAERTALSPGGVALNTLWYETDRAALYQAQLSSGAPIWALVMCRPLRTATTKPSDLGTDDAGFTWFDSTNGVEWRWSGSVWNYYRQIVRDTWANLPDPAVADRMVLFIVSDRGDHVYRKAATTWVLIEGVGGPMRGTTNPDQRPSLGTDDAGFVFYSTDTAVTDNPDTSYRWTGAAWAAIPSMMTTKLNVVTAFGIHSWTAGGTGINRLRVRNTTAGTGNIAALEIGNDASATAGSVLVTSSTFTTGGGIVQDSVALIGARAGGIDIRASDASGDVRITSRNTLALTVGASQLAAFAGAVTIASTAAGALDVAGGAEFGSGNVAVIGTDGKINGPLSSTIIDDLSGANLTTLNATNISSGTLSASRLPTDAVQSTSNPVTAGAPYTNNAYVEMTVNGSVRKIMTTAG